MVISKLTRHGIYGVFLIELWFIVTVTLEQQENNVMRGRSYSVILYDKGRVLAKLFMANLSTVNGKLTPIPAIYNWTVQPTINGFGM